MERVAWLLGLAVALSACGDLSLGPQNVPPRLGVAPRRAVIGLGDTTSVVITLRNTTPRPITLTFTTGCQILLYIRAEPSSDIVYPRGGNSVCTLAISHLFLGPWAQRTQKLLIRGGYSSEPGDGAILLERGQYLIYATMASNQYFLQAEPALLMIQ